jgi:RNA 3'-terminal phosphate cyclase (ATP)
VASPGEPLLIDGSQGEGGGQVLRTALALSLCRQRPFRMERIRAARRRPGLMPQHLAAVRAVAELSRAEVQGAELGSQSLLFRPRQAAKGGRYRFSIGTAGSTTLLAQALLPALLTAPGPSELLLEGGTHNPLAPSFEFLERAFLPLVARMGPTLGVELERPGFYPVGGGRIRLRIDPVRRLRSLELPSRGPVLALRATSLLCRLPRHIAERELETVGRAFDLGPDLLRVLRLDSGRSPGNALILEIESEEVTEVIVGVGRRGLPAEAVAEGVAARARTYLQAGVPVGSHLADQLLLPLALAGKGSFLTVPPSLHTRTNLQVIRAFLPAPWTSTSVGEDGWLLALG